MSIFLVCIYVCEPHMRSGIQRGPKRVLDFLVVNHNVDAGN